MVGKSTKPDDSRKSENRDESKICGAKKRDGTICKAYVVPGRNRCKYHGGASPVGGPTHHTFKHGRTSKYLPGKLGDKFSKAYNDPELLSHRKYAALFDVRVQELCSRLYTGEAGDLWARLKQHWGELETAQADIREAREAASKHREAAEAAETDEGRREALAAAAKADERAMDATERFGKSLRRVGRTIADGNANEMAWKELMATSAEASAMKTRETKRLESERMMVPITEVMTLVAAIYSNCRDSADAILPPDKSRLLLSRVGEGMQKILHRSGGSDRDLHKTVSDRYGAGVVIDEATSAGEKNKGGNKNGSSGSTEQAK